MYLFSILLIASSTSFASKGCEDWFNSSKIKKDAGCYSKCIVAKVDMSSFDCHGECESLCKEKEISYSILKYYGLTDDEIGICDHTPKLCVKGYLASMKAEETCLQIYPSSRTNDETDACRHFMWALHLREELDSEDAEKILNAHENNPNQPIEEKSMDLANNRLGLLTYNNLKTKDSISEKSFIEEFRKSMRENKLIIIKPRYQKTGGLP